MVIDCSGPGERGHQTETADTVCKPRGKMLLNISRIFMWDTSMHEAVKTRHSAQCEAILTVLKTQSSLGSEENEWRMNEK